MQGSYLPFKDNGTFSFVRTLIVSCNNPKDGVGLIIVSNNKGSPLDNPPRIPPL